LGLGVHDERAVVKDGFPNRATTHDEDFHPRSMRILLRRCAYRDALAGAAHRELALVDRVAYRPDRAAARQHVDERVELPVPWEVQLRAGLDRGVYQRD